MENNEVQWGCFSKTGLIYFKNFIFRYPDIRVIERGIQVLIDRQLPNGDWPQVSKAVATSPIFI